MPDDITVSAQRLTSQMTFKHYIVQRFNLGLYSSTQKTRGGEKIDPDKWMQSRMILWERYTVPSIYAQTNQNFTWIVVFDPDTPKGYLERATALLHPKHRIVLGRNFRQAVKKSIGKVESERLITSRCDNDDSLHREYVERIQAHFCRKGKTGVLVFPTGWIWNPAKGKLYHSRYLKNPFLTLIEKPQRKVHTVLAHRHTKITDMFRTHRLEGGHMWLQIVHGENLANYCHGDQVAESKLVKGDFGVC